MYSGIQTSCECNTTGTTYGEGTAYPSGAPLFTIVS